MKATLSLGPFSDSSIPVILDGKCYMPEKVINEIPFLQQLYAEVEETATVNPNSNWIYKGLTLKINQIKPRPRFADLEHGRLFYLSLIGTPFENRHTLDKYTVIWENDLVINKKQYLVSYSPKDYPMPDEVEGEVKEKAISPNSSVYYFIPKLPENKTVVQNPMDYAKNAAAKESTYLPKEMRQAGYEIVDGELKQPEKDIVRIGNDNICPITKQNCDDETCTPGAECNISGDDISACDQEVMPKAQTQPVSFTPEQRERVVELVTEILLKTNRYLEIIRKSPEFKLRESAVEIVDKWLNNQNI